MSSRDAVTHLIVVPTEGPDGELGPRTHPYRLVRPYERVWPGNGLLHAVVPDMPPSAQVTGCGHEIPDPDRIGRACDFPGHPPCPAFECFGET